MKELSMHVYDLMENSTAANSTEVKLTIRDSIKDNDFHFTIEDNGKGMSPEFLAKVTDPYTTSRTTRKVGLGLPLIKMNTENCGGGMKLTSELGKGTRRRLRLPAAIRPEEGFQRREEGDRVQGLHCQG